MIKKVIISGGGTGGHIYPALAIANQIKERYPEVDILFVGAKDRMEMEKVPKAGYPIVGLEIAGLQRSLSPRNLSFPFKVVKSYMKARQIVKDFGPQIAIGVGGYASAPTLYAASRAGIPTLIQEQNSYAGLTNKLLSKRAKRICVAYPNMGKFFDDSKIVYTGNPVRKDIAHLDPNNSEAYQYFGIDPNRKTLLIIGGSLGARSINEAILDGLAKFHESGIQVLWQTGKYFFAKADEAVKEYPNIQALQFISRMDYAYTVADIVVSRAGALSISELCLVGKPAILIPSPNVAEDHQTKNAQALSTNNAALLLKDHYAQGYLPGDVLDLFSSPIRQKELSQNILRFAKPHAAKDIVSQIEQVVK